MQRHHAIQPAKSRASVRLHQLITPLSADTMPRRATINEYTDAPRTPPHAPEQAVKEHGVLGLISHTPLVELSHVSPNPKVPSSPSSRARTSPAASRIASFFICLPRRGGWTDPARRYGYRGQHRQHRHRPRHDWQCVATRPPSSARATSTPRSRDPPRLWRQDHLDRPRAWRPRSYHQSPRSGREHGIFFLDQFGNDSNVETHYQATGPADLPRPP